MNTTKNDLGNLARRLVAARAAHGNSRAAAKMAGQISAVGTERSYRTAVHCYLDWRESVHLVPSGPHLLCDLCEFLDEQAQRCGQAWLDQLRQALQVTFAVTLPYAKAIRQPSVTPRALSVQEYRAIWVCASWRSQLSIDLGIDAGLRAAELFELRRTDEACASPHRHWSPSRFHGRAGYVLYVCTGKGGLAREVAISIPLAAQLEARRYASPQLITDRGIRRATYYDLAAGQSISQLFTAAARRANVKATGFHALRHTFAQRRFAELALTLPDVRERFAVLAQELGHFAWTQPLTYLR